MQNPAAAMQSQICQLRGSRFSSKSPCKQRGDFLSLSTLLQYFALSRVRYKRNRMDGDLRGTIRHAQYRRFQTTCAIQHLLLERQPYLKDRKLKISNAD